MNANTTTLKDIASVLDVSISTVSKALRNSNEISTSTKKRVLKTAKTLNYTPNLHATALRNKRSLIIGVILPNLKDSFFLDSLNGITEESFKNDYKIMIYQSCNDFKKEIQYSNLLFESNIIDGLIFSTTNSSLLSESKKHLKNFVNKGIPVSYINKMYRTSVNNTYNQRGFEIGRNSVKELLSKIGVANFNLSA